MAERRALVDDRSDGYELHILLHGHFTVFGGHVVEQVDGFQIVSKN